MKNLFILGSLFCLSLTSLGQTFTAEAHLPDIQKDGFYFVLLPPNVCSLLNNELSDLRIYDEKNQEVPYLLDKATPKYYSTQFKEYKVLEKKQSKDKITRLTLYNPDRQPINNISLIIKNAEVTKKATLLGSDDRKSWYALKESFFLYPVNNPNGVTATKVVDFPLSNYLYYALEVNDSVSAPMNILKVGYYESLVSNGSYIPVPSMRMTLSDSQKYKKSYVQLAFDTLRLVDKIEFSMEGQPYFLRKATLYETSERITKKGKREKYLNALQSFELSSTHSSILDLSGTKIHELVIVIHNEDNPPLIVTSVNAYQLNRFAVAWLKKGKAYSMKMGNTSLRKPAYDITYFKDSIPNDSPILLTGSIQVKNPEPIESSDSFFNSKNFIWAAIVGVVILLGAMSFKLTREIGKKS